MRAPIGRGFGVGFRWVVGAVLLVENEENRGGGVGRVGGAAPVETGKEPASKCALLCQNHIYRVLPFSFSPIERKIGRHLVGAWVGGV